MDKWAELVQQLAANRGGVVLTADLTAAGLRRDDLRTATHGLFRLRRGAYTLREPDGRQHHHELLARAVIAQQAPGAVLSHTSAGALHGFPVPDGQLAIVHITDPDSRVRTGRRHGVHSHSGPLGPDEVVLIDGLPVTAAPRTVVDCARQLSVAEALVVADDALHRRAVSHARLHAEVAALARLPGIAAARHVAEMADGRSESPGETRTRLLLTQAGWRVEPQAVITDSGGRFLARVDFLLTGAPIVVEFDGRAKYSVNGDVEAAHWREKQRHDALNDAGYLVVRVVWRDLRDAAIVVGKIRSAVSRARRLGLPA